MSNQETLSALAALSQRICDKATEARREFDYLKAEGRHPSAALASVRCGALIEFGNEVDRIITQAQKASVDQPSPAVRSSAGFGELEAAPSEQSGAGGWRDEITCPHCGYEAMESYDWGCPDVDWTEVTECPQCEKQFEWTRLKTVQYLALPVAGVGGEDVESKPGHSPNVRTHGQNPTKPHSDPSP